MFDLSELDKLKRTRNKKAIPTVALYLNENNEYTGKYEVFESGGEASRAMGVSSGGISDIIHQKQHHYTATHRNGRKVTFVNAYATQEEVTKHLERVKEVENDPSPIAVKMIYIDENNESTEEYEVFESRSKASRATDVHSGHISGIIDPTKHHYTATHRNRRKVTFVNASATKEEIDEQLRRVKEIESDPSPISVKMLYIDENDEYTGEYEIFESGHETSRVTGVDSRHLSRIINQIQHNYTATHKNGRKVTFVNASATKEEIDEQLRRVKEVKNDTYPVSVKMIYIDENNEDTGEYEVFESRGETSRAADVAQTSIYGIINQRQHNYTATHKNGRKVTFVNASATKEEIDEQLRRVKEVKNDTYPVSVKMIYIDENNEDTGEYEVFESRGETSRAADVAQTSIYGIINQKNNRYTATHKNGKKVTFVNANATKEEIKKHIQRITNR